MRAISVRQPWAWLIVSGAKDIENRTWRTRIRGTVLVHASSQMSQGDWLKARDLMWRVHGTYVPMELPRGGIVGMVTITDCVTESASPWFTGPYGFVLADAKRLPFLPMKGKLGFFEVPDGLVEEGNNSGLPQSRVRSDTGRAAGAQG